MGIVTKLFAWVAHPSIEQDQEPKDWALGLVVVLAIAFLWSRVVRQLVEA